MNDYCKTCKHDDDIGFCDKCLYNRVLEERGIPPTMYEAKPKPQTNADRIRQMADEELAELFATTGNGLKACPDGAKYPKSCENGCGNCWLDWLKSPVTEGA